MNTLFVVALASFAAFTSASPSGILGGTVVAGPTLLGGGAVLTAPSASAVISGPALAGPILAGPALAAPLAVAAAPALGVGAITGGGGTISATAAGAAVRGPPTAPVVVSGPSGKIAADGLWGPTANIGLGALGKAW